MADPAIADAAAPAPAQSLPWWFALGQRCLRPWVRLKREPGDSGDLLLPERPVCYVLERHGLSDALILERACRDAGLPSPMGGLAIGGLQRRHALFALTRRDGWLLGRTRKRASEAALIEMLEALGANPDSDIQLVPVSIYVGRAPARANSWFRVLFSENWVMVGRFRRLLAIALNGRDTVVQFARPVSLRQAIDEAPELEPPRLARKLSRVLRVHFRRIRAAVIGPDLSHRRTVIDSVLGAAPVREAIVASAARNKTSTAKARKRARKMVLEIAADYSHPVLRSASLLCAWLWNKLYAGVGMYHFDQAREAAPGHEIIYVPSHRSHADYLLLSYQLHASGVVVPHIAAGKNLDLPVLGPLLRRGGAFFLRRSFKGSALYTTIFKEYLAQLISRGVPIEYFIEGGRSRTGRLLHPKGGMLAMTVRAYLRAPRRPVLFQPVYIGYEKLMEGTSYSGELSGQPKQKESLPGLWRSARKVLKQHYGHVALSFGEPVALNDMLDATGADWQAGLGDDDGKPAWFAEVVDQLAARIQVNINAAAHVNAINLLAVVLLATPKHAMAEDDLLKQLGLTATLLAELPYSGWVTVSDDSPEDIIAHGERMGWIERVNHPAGDVLRVDADQAILLSYFRNNVLHLMACTAWVASCFLNNQRLSRSSIIRLGRIIYPFIRGELHLPWDEQGFAKQLQATIDAFVRLGLLESRRAGQRLQRQPGQTDSAYQLRVLAHSLLQAFERYYIAVAALTKSGSGTLSAAELERTSISTAQRLGLLHELNAPEFFDKALFRGFIRRLRERKLVWTNDDNKLEFEAGLEAIVEDASLILTREVRHSILKITPGDDLREESVDERDADDD